MGKPEISPTARSSEDGTEPQTDTHSAFWLPGSDVDISGLLFYIIEYVDEKVYPISRRLRSMLKTGAWVAAAGCARIMSCYRPHFASMNTQNIGEYLERDQRKLTDKLEIWLLQGSIVFKVSAII